jgi:hypothetical protein
VSTPHLPVERLLRLSREQACRIDAYRMATYTERGGILNLSAAMRRLLDLGLEAAAKNTERAQP